MDKEGDTCVPAEGDHTGELRDHRPYTSRSGALRSVDARQTASSEALHRQERRRPVLLDRADKLRYVRKDEAGLRSLTDTGDDHAAFERAELLDRREDEAGLRSLAETGNDHAALQLGDLLADTGNDALPSTLAALLDRL